MVHYYSDVEYFKRRRIYYFPHRWSVIYRSSNWVMDCYGCRAFCILFIHSTGNAGNGYIRLEEVVAGNLKDGIYGTSLYVLYLYSSPIR